MTRTLWILIIGISIAGAQEKKPVAHWSFDQVKEGKVRDSVGEWEDIVSGNFRMVRGIKGQAIVMDGYTTNIVRQADSAPKLGPDFTVEAWIALGAYPWNWAPIAARESTISMNSNLDAVCWPEDIVVNSPRNGFFFGISPEGYLGLHVGARGWQVCRTDKKIPLFSWTHVAATFRRGEGVVLYIDGQKTAEMKIQGGFRPDENADLRIGMAHQKLEPTHPVRVFATLACWYSLDGILDELRIHNEALAVEKVTESYNSSKTSAKPDLPPRIMPSGPPGPGVFGASYMHLKYYPEWDALWPVAQVPSDGRYCQAADRASHFSLAWGGPPAHKGKRKTYWWAWMYGATTERAELLINLARSWLIPPRLVVDKGAEDSRYDMTQRCYVIAGLDSSGKENLQIR
jgi:hypothetical protein